MNNHITIAQEYVFSPQDYRGMKFNVMGADRKTPLLQQFPDLARFRSFLDVQAEFPLICDHVVRYICLCYDRFSPAFSQIGDIFKRKSWCGMASGFTYNADTGVFDKEFYDIMNGQHECVNMAVIDFSSLFNSPAYSMLVTAYEAFYSKTRIMNKVVSLEGKDVISGEKTRGELYNQLKVMAADISAHADKYLADNNIFLREDLYRVVQEEVRNRLNLTPESRATWRKQQATNTATQKK